MTEKSANIMDNENKEKTSRLSTLNKKIATTAIFIAVGVVLSYLNPFAYFLLFGTKINPFVHFINSLTGVLIGLAFSCVAALGIAALRFVFGIGTIHAFHGGISGAIVVGTVAGILRKKAPKHVEFAALSEPIGTVFIGGTIAQLIAPIGGIEGILTYWGLFAASSVPGCIVGFLILKVLKRAGISWQDYFQ